MKIWFDTEFIEDGKTIDLISIGLVREDGTTLYIENSECDHSRASDWVKANVLPKLTGPSAAVPRFRIAQCVREFAGKDPEFWGYYADYDWVVLCQLYGTMMDLPKGWPMFCRDVQQIACEAIDANLPPQPEGEHNALADAIWTRQAYEALAWLPRKRVEYGFNHKATSDGYPSMIEWIKEYRSRTGATLKASKDAYESNEPMPVIKFWPDTSGCAL